MFAKSMSLDLLLELFTAIYDDARNLRNGTAEYSCGSLQPPHCQPGQGPQPAVGLWYANLESGLPMGALPTEAKESIRRTE
jgi:hypothetical protein